MTSAEGPVADSPEEDSSDAGSDTDESQNDKPDWTFGHPLVPLGVLALLRLTVGPVLDVDRIAMTDPGFLQLIEYCVIFMVFVAASGVVVGTAAIAVSFRIDDAERGARLRKNGAIFGIGAAPLCVFMLWVGGMLELLL